MGIAKVKSVSGPVVNSGVRATGATAVAIFDTRSQAATDAHSNCTVVGPSVLTQSSADWLVTSPTATPCGSPFAETGTVSAKGLPGGSPSRDAAAQLDWEMSKAKSRKKIERDAIMAMDLPEWERCVKRSLIDNHSILRFCRMLKKSASFVLASFRPSTYPRGYASALHSLRPC